MKIKLYTGKYYIALRIGDLGFGIGRPGPELRAQVDNYRRHRGI